MCEIVLEIGACHLKIIENLTSHSHPPKILDYSGSVVTYQYEMVEEG